MARLKAQIEELKEGAHEEDSEDKVNIMQSQQVLEEMPGGGGLGGCKRLSLSFILLKGVYEYFLVGASLIVTCFIHGHSRSTQYVECLWQSQFHFHAGVGEGIWLYETFSFNLLRGISQISLVWASFMLTDNTTQFHFHESSFKVYRVILVMCIWFINKIHIILY